ncbi:unnamed protein product [Rotaria socialis]|uniref:Uncharacterized protein n=1 Tax=Rotaria socialis TaxID=392032 RepID=A0A820TAD1_9BILA|nr:unnamed protein product [Rotaria socialis]CAF4887134.1 unnamed protein product [Rotaria socialis]
MRQWHLQRGYFTQSKRELYFSLDPVHVQLHDIKRHNSTIPQLLVNGGFETGNLNGWVYCNPYNANYSGSVTSLVSYSGTYSYLDGSVGYSDYLSQSFSVKSQSAYSIRFRLYAYGNFSQYALVTLF